MIAEPIVQDDVGDMLGDVCTELAHIDLRLCPWLLQARQGWVGE